MKRIAVLVLALLASPAFAQCFVSGVTDQYTYFVAVDSTDFTTRETGLSSFTVRRSRNGGASAAFTTPTINETDSSNMPGVYELLLDEDMTIDSGDDMQHMTLHITADGMAPVTKEICIARAKITAGETVTATSGRVNADAVAVSGDTGAADALEAAFDGTAGAVSPLGIARQGTAQSATSTTLVLDSAASFADDVPIGMTLVACGSTQGYCQSRVVTDYTSSSDTATVDAWTVTPSGTITYYLFGTAPVEGAGGATAEEVWAYSDRTITGGTVTTNSDKTGYSLSSSQTFSNTGTWTGNITGNVGGTVNGLTSTAQGNVRDAVGLSTANLDTQLGDLPTNSELTSALNALAAAGVYSLGYRNADGDECVMVISESDPKLDVTCTEAE